MNDNTVLSLGILEEIKFDSEVQTTMLMFPHWGVHINVDFAFSHPAVDVFTDLLEPGKVYPRLYYLIGTEFRMMEAPTGLTLESTSSSHASGKLTVKFESTGASQVELIGCEQGMNIYQPYP